MPTRRLNVSLPTEDAMHVTRLSLGKERLVYVIKANKKLKYGSKRSKIAYIGTTKKGISRIASSVAYRANKILNLHGVKSFTVAIVSCKGRKHVRTWFRLERALLVKFCEIYDGLPVCNGKGHKMKHKGVWKLFQEHRIQTIIEDLS
jgi:hypothetical protein